MLPATRVSSAPVSADGNVRVQMPGGAADIARRIEHTLVERRCGLAQHLAPERKLFRYLHLLRMPHKPLRPIPERSPARRQRSLSAIRIAAHAAARSGTRIRHDTPSTER